ncbi:MAG: AlpA family transcriptional regulator [Colwellia sp.]
MRFIKLDEVMHCTGLGRSSIYKYMNNGDFPRSISLGDRAVAWVESEVHDWMAEKLAMRDKLQQRVYK